jgi:hypothetical protein
MFEHGFAQADMTCIDLPPRVVPQVKLVWPQPSGPDLVPAMRVV